MNTSLRSFSLVGSALFCGGLVALAAFAPIRAMLVQGDLYDPPPIVIVKETPTVKPRVEVDPPPVRQRLPTIPDLPLTPTEPAIFDAGPALDPVGPTPPAPADITDAIVQTPRGQDFAKLYPERAIYRNISGKTTIHCYVRADGGVDCTITEETPQGWGFGAAALKAAKLFKVSPRMANGQPTEGGTFTRTFHWRMQE